MNIDTTIYGYVGDGDAVCPGCYTVEFGVPGDGWTSALYSLDDQGYGLTCDVCHAWIFEPYLDTVKVLDGVSIVEMTGWNITDVPSTITVTFDDSDDDGFEVTVEPVDSDYGHVFAAFDEGRSCVALFASPDHPDYEVSDFDNLPRKEATS